MRRPWLTGPVLLGCGWAACGPAAGRADEPAPAPVPPLAAIVQTSGSNARPASDRITVLAAGTSSRAAHDAARAALPVGRLTPADRGRCEAVLREVSLFRAMPTVRTVADPGAYRYFVEHPDVAVSIWRALGASQCQLWQTGPNAYDADLGDGSVGIVDVLYRGDAEQLVLARGKFKSPLLASPIEATALLHLRTEFVVRADGETEAVSRTALFVSFPSQAVETAAKVISPFTNVVLDRNLEEIALFANMMTAAMRTQPGWVEDVAGRLDGVLDRRRPELLQVTARAYVSHRRRQLEREGRPVSAESILAPLDAVTMPGGS